MKRPSWDQYFMDIARTTALMGTCARRQVGCVLVDERNTILATGFNGVPPKWGHCRENPEHACPGAESKSGTNLDGCLANHAEVNALLHCRDVFSIATVYTTTSPCISCVKALLCTGAHRIVFSEEYPHFESKELWTRHGVHEAHPGWVLHRLWEQLLPLPNVATKVLASSEFRNQPSGWK